MQIKNAVITLGATHEPIDPVRFLGNRSSGRQGLALVRVLLENNVNTTVVYGVVSESIQKELDILANFDPSLTLICATTAVQMLEACETAIRQHPVDLFIGVAAVCDFRAENPLEHKLKKHKGESLNDLKFVENPDIVATVAHMPQRPKVVVAFAAETEELVPNARKKLISKGCDIVVANDVSHEQVMGQDSTTIMILSGKDKMMPLPKTTKLEAAKHIFDYIWRFKVVKA